MRCSTMQKIILDRDNGINANVNKTLSKGKKKKNTLQARGCRRTSKSWHSVTQRP